MKTELISQVSVTVPSEAEEPAAALLERLFGQLPSIYESAETKQSRVSVYLRKEAAQLRGRKKEIREGLKALRECGLDLGEVEVMIRRVPRQDWSESWKKFFKTIRVGKALMVKPSWSKEKASPGEATVVLDPGLSFGTGQHATTSFCLKEIVRNRGRGGGSFLDIGTGSGILAIAASKLGYEPVEAFDFDPVAVRVASANCKRNRVEGRVRVTRRDLTKLTNSSRNQFDLVCANLISTLLLQEREKIVNRVAPGGTLVLAGILVTEFAGVRRAYREEGLELVRSAREREWESGSFRFHP